MPKTYDETTKSTARSYYVMLGFDAEKISAILGPTAKTIREWANDGDWEKQRALKNSSGLSIAIQALSQISRIYQAAEEEERLMTSKEVDMVAKQRKMLEGMNKDLGFVSNAIEAQGLFMEFLQERNHELFDQLTEYSLDFTQHLVEQFGGV